MNKKTLILLIACALVLMLICGGCGGGGGGSAAGGGGDSIVDDGGGDDGGDDGDGADGDDGSDGDNGDDGSDGDDGNDGDDGDGDDGGGGDSPAVDEMVAKISSFGLQDWDLQEWQLGMDAPAGEVHPMLPVRFNVGISTSRLPITTDDEIWASVWFVGDNGEEPFGDIAIGADILNDSTARNADGTITIEIWTYSGTPPGTYKSLRAEFSAPGETAVIEGRTGFSADGPVTLLDREKSAQIGDRWTVVDIIASPPETEPAPVYEKPDEDGEVTAYLETMTEAEARSKGLNIDMTVDPGSGFQYYYGSDPESSWKDSNSAPGGYYSTVNFNIKLLSTPGRIAYLEIGAPDGINFWDAGKGRFVSKYQWKGSMVADVADDGTPSYFQGFPSGQNGTALIVGGTGEIPRGLTVADIKLSVAAYDAGGNKLPGEVAGAEDESMTQAVANAEKLAAARSSDKAGFWEIGTLIYPEILPADTRRAELPMMDVHRKIMSYSSGLVVESTFWGELGRNVKFGSMGRADYSAVGTRYISSWGWGDKDYFASSLEFLFEQYSGMAARPSGNGELRTHNVAGVAGTRLYNAVNAWISGKQYKLFVAASEFRNQVQAVTMTKRQADGSYKLLSRAEGDGARMDRLNAQATMRSEFAAELTVMGKTIIAPYLTCDNRTPYETKYTDYELLKISAGPRIPDINLVIIKIGGGITANFYVKLQLSNNIVPYDDGPDVLGRIALVPGADVTAWIQGGFDIWLVAASAGASCRLVWAEIQPAYIMQGGVKWFMDGKNPSLMSGWSSKPVVDAEVGTLDLYVYASASVWGGAASKSVEFRYEGSKWKQRVWDGYEARNVYRIIADRLLNYQVVNPTPDSFELR